MDKRKFYYDINSKRIEVRPFYDDYEEQDKPYVELTFEEWQEKLSTCAYGYMKAYINNEIVEDCTIESISNLCFLIEETDKDTLIYKIRYYVLKISDFTNSSILCPFSATRV